MHLPAEELSPENLSHSKALALFDLVNRLRRVWVNFEPEPPLKRSEMSMLGLIVHQKKSGEEEITVGSLAKVMRQSVPGVSQKIAALEKYGYIERITDSTDRRTATLELTKKGTEIAKCAFHQFINTTELALDAMGEAKTDCLLEQLQEFCNALEKTKNSGNKPV